MFQKKEGVKRSRTNSICNIFFLRKLYRLWDNVENYCRGEQATDDNMACQHCTLYT